MFELGQKVVTKRGLTATVLDIRDGDGEIGPHGVRCYLCQDDGEHDGYGLLWQVESDLKNA